MNRNTMNTKFEKYSNQSSEENLLNVKQEEGDQAKLLARANHFKSRIIKDGLSKGDKCEEGAYAKVLDTREKFRLALQIAKPQDNINPSTVDEYLSNLDTITTNQNLKKVIKKRAKAYQEALTQHKNMVRVWSNKQTQSTHVLLSSIKSDAKGSENLLLKGRVEYLKRSVKYQKDYFNKCRSNFQEVLTKLQDRLEAIDPDLVGKSRFDSSGWNLFTWIANIISSWWNKDTVLDLKRRCSLLKTELDKPEPSNEKEFCKWFSLRKC